MEASSIGLLTHEMPSPNRSLMKTKGSDAATWPVALVLMFVMVLAAPAATNQPANSAKIRIVLVGDSTVTDNAGWGLGFKRFLTEGAECVNTAQGGRSSESFRREGRWTNALALKGDYYLIQFGHNNEPGKP